MLYYLIHEHQGETDGDSASHLFQYNCKTKKANELFAETQ